MSVLTALQTPEHISERVTIRGWVHRIRNHGKVGFIDLRDRSGIVQVVSGTFLPTSWEAFQRLTPESCVIITGAVVARSEKLVNPELPTGSIEVQAEELTIVSIAETPPFQLDTDTRVVEEELRLAYRYLDLRSERMRDNIVARAKLVGAIRRFLDFHGFIEVDTPVLTATTPEGARDFVVPTQRRGEFYALPQSPQQFKQLLMVAGVERYYQIARCFRDEGTRGDRQPEFTQLDLEMSFATQDEIFDLTEELFTTVIGQLYPEKHFTFSPWPRISYAEAMEKYGSDKPDLRVNKDDNDELAAAWIVDFPLFEEDKEGGLTFAHNPFSMPHEADVEKVASNDRATLLSLKAQCYDFVINGYEMCSGSIRITKPELQRRIFEIMGLSAEQIDRQFGHMLKAYTYGAPTHGGLAPGIDRLLMILQGEPNIREVIPFAKTGEGRDPLMSAPGPLSATQLKELHLTVSDK
jgi:aspartyl-tRNA synthetase